uniref:Uncharacterized protein n=1 Tax=Rhizophora mucronata TaxID=61149 RepID=A0A2P2NQ83_RHIMU
MKTLYAPTLLTNNLLDSEVTDLMNSLQQKQREWRTKIPLLPMSNKSSFELQVLYTLSLMWSHVLRANPWSHELSATSMDSVNLAASSL